MIKIQNLDLITRETLLYAANMNLEKGLVYGLSARNGTGKTTLLRTISGLRSESLGSISIQENDKELDFPKIKNHLFYYETSEWFDLNLSGWDYLKFIESTWNNKSYMSIDELVSYWEMDRYIKSPIRKYSLGMKQKVLLSMYGVSGADYLLLDEPTIGLDTNSQKLFEKFIIKVKSNGACVLFSSHQNDGIYAVCDYIYEMENKSLKLVNTRMSEN